MAATGLSHFVLAHFEIDFLRELQWPCRAEAAAAITRTGRTSFGMRHAVFDRGTCVSHADAVLVAIDGTTRRPVELGSVAIAFLQAHALKPA